MRSLRLLALPLLAWVAAARTDGKRFQEDGTESLSLLEQAHVATAPLEGQKGHSLESLARLAAAENPRAAFGQAFIVVGVAEMFDKTWFVALLYSLYHGPRIAFLGSFLALSMHTFLAAGLGAVVSKFAAVWVLHLVTAAVFAIFAGFYAYEFYWARPDEDALKSRADEAKEAVGEEGMPGSGEAAKRSWQGRLAQVALAVFVAEWGDRTQVAMISLHSSMPVLPVCLGSLAAFFTLSGSAALVAKALEGQTLSERCISGLSAVSFLVFAATALASGLREMHGAARGS